MFDLADAVEVGAGDLGSEVGPPHEVAHLREKEREFDHRLTTAIRPLFDHCIDSFLPLLDHCLTTDWKLDRHMRLLTEFVREERERKRGWMGGNRGRGGGGGKRCKRIFPPSPSPSLPPCLPACLALATLRSLSTRRLTAV